MITFGPVPSRRLGQSLGINHIPPKICSYSCIYCQLGRTIKMQSERSRFYDPYEVVREVEEHVKKTREKEERIDYLTFVPDGEPTLDTNLGKAIDMLKPFGFKVAVISNSSLVWYENVRRDLLKADWVSLKVDAISETVWRQVNRPHRILRLGDILDGLKKFTKIYRGELATETMLIEGINDKSEEIEKIKSFLAELNPDKAYISIPTRPPAEEWVKPANEESINLAYQIFKGKLRHVEYLIGYEGNAFAFSGNVEDDLLSITSVHPMREEAVRKLLTKAESDWGTIEKLIEENKLIELRYLGDRFYMRKLLGRF